MKENSIPLSVLIPCKNEERNLDRCLKSISWVNEVFVVDSQSTDRTQEISKKYKANVVQFSYKGG